ncbi:MAG: DUF1844 domain-containing protein [Candidatus Acidiferrales bacterium]
MSDHKPEETFRVIDRRLFTNEGELRKEAVEEERKQEAAQAQQAAAKPATPASLSNTPSGAVAAPANTHNPSPAFKNLLAFLARNAELVMAGLPDPRTGRSMVDIESLRQLIDMLEVLKEKTTGNLAAEDEQLLTEVIGDLKVSFVQLQQAAMAQQTARQAGSGRKP